MESEQDGIVLVMTYMEEDEEQLYGGYHRHQSGPREISRLLERPQRARKEQP